MIQILVLIIYDIHTETADGRKRLRQIARKCESVGKRVQHSVFECLLDAAQFRYLQTTLTAMINPETDNLRFYNLGNHYDHRIIIQGSATMDYYESPIIL